MKKIALCALLVSFVAHESTCIAKSIFGGWSIDWPVYDFIRRHIPEGETILEFGSGRVTGELAKHYSVISIEHDEAWLDKYESNYIYAPIVNRWYDLPAVTRGLKGKEYAAILIDGPPGCGGRAGRYGLLENIELFNTDVLIIVDDIHRDEEKQLLESLSQMLGRPYQVIWGTNKAAAVILPK